VRVLLLSATTGYQLRSFNTAAERLGIDLAFATDRCHMLDDPWRDNAIAVRFHEESASLDLIAAAAAKIPFDGLVSVGDRPTILTARAAERLGLPGNPPDAAAASSNKAEAKRRFAAAGLNVPWHLVLATGEDEEQASRDPRVAYPCVLKPVGLSASRGVIRADAREEFIAAFRRIRALLGRADVRAARTGLDDVLLVEGYIPGREFAIEGVLTNGALHVFAIFDKPDPLVGPFFEETIYVTPPALEMAEKKAIVKVVGQAAAALGLRHGPVHAECRLGSDGLLVLEIAARPIGGLCSKALRLRSDALADGESVSLEEVLLRHSVGEDVARWTREHSASAVMMIPIPTRGLFKRTSGEEDARAVAHVEDVIITAKRDQLLERLPEAGSYLGFIFARADCARDAEAAVRDAHRRLTFSIDAPIDVVAG
jgi:biotin carboxylase